MKRVKIGIVVVLAAVAVYFIVSYTIFFIKKSRIDRSFLYEEQTVVIQKQPPVYDNEQEVIHVEHDLEYHTNFKPDFEESLPDDKVEFVILPEPEKKLPVIQAQETEEFALIKGKKKVEPELYSFVSKPFALFEDQKVSSSYQSVQQLIKLDVDTQESFDILIGNDFNRFINLVLQSNNDIVSEQACRSCSLYALFKKVKNHKILTEQDIKTLQHIIGNLYRFMNRMKQLSKKLMMTPEQYIALQDLNRPQAVKDAMRLQARKAATSAALRKLQSIKYNN